MRKSTHNRLVTTNVLNIISLLALIAIIIISCNAHIAMSFTSIIVRITGLLLSITALFILPSRRELRGHTTTTLFTFFTSLSIIVICAMFNPYLLEYPIAFSIIGFLKYFLYPFHKATPNPTPNAPASTTPAPTTTPQPTEEDPPTTHPFTFAKITHRMLTFLGIALVIFSLKYFFKPLEGSPSSGCGMALGFTIVFLLPFYALGYILNIIALLHYHQVPQPRRFDTIILAAFNLPFLIYLTMPELILACTQPGFIPICIILAFCITPWLIIKLHKSSHHFPTSTSADTNSNNNPQINPMPSSAPPTPQGYNHNVQTQIFTRPQTNNFAGTNRTSHTYHLILTVISILPILLATICLIGDLLTSVANINITLSRDISVIALNIMSLIIQAIPMIDVAILILSIITYLHNKTASQSVYRQVRIYTITDIILSLIQYPSILACIIATMPTATGARITPVPIAIIIYIVVVSVNIFLVVLPSILIRRTALKPQPWQTAAALNPHIVSTSSDTPHANPSSTPSPTTPISQSLQN